MDTSVLKSDLESFASMILHVSESDEIEVGISHISEIGKSLKFVDFTDSIHLDYIKVVLSQLKPDKVVVACEQSKTRNAIIKYLTTRGIGHIEIPIPSDDYDSDEIISRIKLYSNGHPFKVNLLKEAPLALNSFKYLDANICEDDIILGEFEVNVHPMEEYMTLDDRAMYSLDLFAETPGNPCIFKLLNHCRTNGGVRLLKKWIRQPLKDEESIRTRLNIVEIFVENTDLRESLHKDTLRRLPDFENLSVRLTKKNCSLAQLYSIFTGIHDIQKIIGNLEDASQSDLTSQFLNTLEPNVGKMKGFMDMIKSSLDFDSIQNGEFFIKSSFDESLAELRGQMDELKAEMEAESETASQDLGLDSSKNMKLQQGDHLGHFFRITLKYEAHLREKNEYNIIESSKSGIKFQTKALAKMSRDYEEIKKQYDQIQRKIVKEVLEIAFGYSKFVFRLGQNLSQLDVLVSFAIAALSSPIPYIKPTIIDSSSHRVIKMLGVRHPCMEISPKISSYIPNDIHLDSESSRFHILTGPNLGGKSTYMRSIAVSIIMAQIGSFVPCDSAEFSLVDKILVRIGAEDRQLEGVSTFMAEMLDVSNIFRTATPKSLAIIDEIGRGTSTYDGIGIALAVAQKLITDLKVFTIFATHFFEITRLGSEHDCVKNYHVSADTSSGNFTLLYKVLEGECNKSFGLEVAKICNFPEELIKESAERLEKYEANQNIANMLDLKFEQYEEIEKVLLNLPSGDDERKKCLLSIKDKFFTEEKWEKLMAVVKSS